MAQMDTPPNLPVQHAKWHPDGSRIVFAYRIPGADPWTMPDGTKTFPEGIAIVDLPPDIVDAEQGWGGDRVE